MFENNSKEFHDLIDILKEKVKTRKIIIPGLLAHMKEEIQEEVLVTIDTGAAASVMDSQFAEENKLESKKMGKIILKPFQSEQTIECNKSVSVNCKLTPESKSKQIKLFKQPINLSK